MRKITLNLVDARVLHVATKTLYESSNKKLIQVTFNKFVSNISTATLMGAVVNNTNFTVAKVDNFRRTDCCLVADLAVINVGCLI